MQASGMAMGAGPLWLLLQASGAFAQADSLPPRPEADKAGGGTIVVTGSRLPQTNLTAISPVMVVRGEEIRLGGIILAEDLINDLPQASPAQGSRANNPASGTATVDLRALGPERTLVLVNGRRLLPGDPLTPFADINIVPTALIARVEVLTGGASSVYGSDAIAGVVNFILDSDFEGVRLDGQYSLYQHRNRAGLDRALRDAGLGVPRGNVADGGSFDVDLAVGAGTRNGRGHVTAFAGYRHLDPVLQGNRDYSACVAQTPLDGVDFGCGGSLTSANGTFATRLGLFQLGPDGSFVRGATPYNYAPQNYFQRPDERYVAGLFGRYEIGAGIQPYAELMLMDDRTAAQVAPAGDFFDTADINCDNPLLSAQQRSIACASGNLVRGEDGNVLVFTDSSGQPYSRGILFVGRRNVEGGPRRDELRHRALRAVAGLRGTLGEGWSYDAYYLYGTTRRAELLERGFSITRLARALDVVAGPDGRPVCRSARSGEDPACVPWNIFAAGAVDPAALDYLQTPGSTRGSVEQQVATASVTGLLGALGVRSPWATEGVSLNAGVEYRRDALDFRPDSVFASGDLAGQGGPVSPVNGRFKVIEGFAEARLPLIENRAVTSLALEAAYRLSRYDNGLNRFSTDTYKIGLDFRPVPDLRLRASVQHAVRAPNIQELFRPRIVSEGGYADPCVGGQPQASAEQCARTGVTAAQYGQLLPSPIDVNNVLVGGNPELAPERATTRSAGIVLQPRWVSGFAATLDWFDIKVRDTIAVIVPSAALRTCLETGDPDFCGRIRRDRFGSLWVDGFVDATSTNIGAIRARGLDFALNYARPLGAGRLSLQLAGSWLDALRRDNGGLSVPFDCAGLYGIVCGSPHSRWRHKARIGWTASQGSGWSLQWRHFSSVSLDRSSDQAGLSAPFSPAIRRIGAQDYLDLTVTFRMGGRYEFRLGARNLLDREPPIVGTGSTDAQGGCVKGCSGNTFPQLYDALGRTLFAGVRVDF